MKVQIKYEQLLKLEEVIEVEADSDDEAEELVKRGYGAPISFNFQYIKEGVEHIKTK